VPQCWPCFALCYLCHPPTRALRSIGQEHARKRTARHSVRRQAAHIMAGSNIQQRTVASIPAPRTRSTIRLCYLLCALTLRRFYYPSESVICHSCYVGGSTKCSTVQYGRLIFNTGSSVSVNSIDSFRKIERLAKSSGILHLFADGWRS